MVVCEDLTYPKVACLGGMVSSLCDVLVTSRKGKRREATMNMKLVEQGQRVLFYSSRSCSRQSRGAGCLEIGRYAADLVVPIRANGPVALERA